MNKLFFKYNKSHQTVKPLYNLCLTKISFVRFREKKFTLNIYSSI